MAGPADQPGQDDPPPEPWGLRAPFLERDELAVHIEPDPALGRWVADHLVDPEGELHNPDHAHLELAEIAYLWTDAELERRGKRIVGAAEIPNPRGHPVTKLRARWALQELRCTPADFVVTLDSVWWARARWPERMALLEHELYHCGQATDEHGLPRFNERTGEPIWALEAHDVEEFTGVVRRYGARAAGRGVEELVEAAGAEPEVAPAEPAALCGTCRRAA